MDALLDYFETIRRFLEYPLFRIQDATISVWTIAYLILSVFLLLLLTRWLSHLVVRKLMARSRYDLGVREAIASIVRYSVIAFGMVLIIQSVGIDLTALTVLAGAVGVGVGFGLQNIADNFISGLIILFERPIKIGDRIEVGDVDGTVHSIGLRSTTVISNDDISIIIPNSQFVSKNVINWSHTETRVRFKIPVGVAYESDPRAVEEALLEVAAEHEDVLANPAPVVRFLAFGESALQFDLRVWTRRRVHQRVRLVSEMNFAIWEKLQARGIRIPYPQLDLHHHGRAPREA